MGWYNLGLQVTLQAITTIAYSIGVGVLAVFVLHDTPDVWVHFAGGAAFGVAGQLFWRSVVLRPWQEHVAFKRMLRQVWLLAEERKIAEQQRGEQD